MNATPQLPPGTQFEGNRKRITPGCQPLCVVVTLEKLLENPVEDTVKQGRANHFDGVEGRISATQNALDGRVSNQSDIMELSERRRVRVRDKWNADSIRTTVLP